MAVRSIRESMGEGVEVVEEEEGSRRRWAICASEEEEEAAITDMAAADTAVVAAAVAAVVTSARHYVRPTRWRPQRSRGCSSRRSPRQEEAEVEGMVAVVDTIAAITRRRAIRMWICRGHC